MTPLPKNVLSTMKGATAKELLPSLWNVPWDKSSFKTIEGLGIAYGSETGAKRKRNEDRLIVAQVTAHSREQYLVAMLCDGVGGSEMGDVAATISLCTFLSELAQTRFSMPLSRLLESLIRRTDDIVRGFLNGSGTTTACVSIVSQNNGDFAAANIGDSRIFSWDPNLHTIAQVSVDDTMENELSQLPVNDPSILDERNLRGRLSQAIGESGRSSTDLRIIVYGRNDFKHGVIMATDGAWKANESGFNAVVANAATSTDAVKRILAFANWTGGIDNVSAIAIDSISRLYSYKNDALDPQIGYIRLSVWVGDGRSTLIISDSAPEWTRTSNERFLHKGTMEANKKPKRKWGKDPKRHKPATTSDKQLDLHATPPLEHPKERKRDVEVSTDENPSILSESTRIAEGDSDNEPPLDIRTDPESTSSDSNP